MPFKKMNVFLLNKKKLINLPYKKKNKNIYI
jgi:hypothetical protein